MREHSGWRKFFLATGGLVSLAFAVVAGVLNAPRLRAQATTTQSPAVPQWQIDAGGKMVFDVASVKENKCGLPPSCSLYSNIDLLPGDNFYAPTGGLFRETNWYLMPLIVFAYRLNGNHYQLLSAQLPKWANAERLDIEARAPISNPTKDQMRLMIQSLLADRFKLVVHFETRQLPVFALVLDKSGKLGPQLREHLDDPPCPDLPKDAPPEAYRATVAGGFPAVCGQRVGDGKPEHIHVGERNVTIEQIGSMLGPVGRVDRPVINRTGLMEMFDFFVEWMPEPNSSSTAQPEPTGPTFLEALKEQLGLKLESKTGPVDVLVIDHIEEPSPN